MRSGKWRGLAVAIALAGAVLAGPAGESRADGWLRHTIPRETLALDYRTGSVMMAPPIPYGCYAKDHFGAIHDAAGMCFGAIHGLCGKLHGLCSNCGGKLCGLCGGHGLLHGKKCGGCGGDGCGNCNGGDPGLGHGGLGHGGLGHGGGLLGHGDGALGHLGHGGHGHGGGFGDGIGSACVGPGCGIASSQLAPTPVAPAKVAAPAPIVSPQAVTVMPTGQSIDPVCGGCLGTGRHASGRGCGLCGGCGRLRNMLGHGGLGHGGGTGMCNACGGRGCGLCRGGDPGNGHGLCKGCGGRGCGLCAGLKGKMHGLLGMPGMLLHRGGVQYFVGAGGPVPLTPGYVPYVVTTRSPRDFLAFPPFSDQIP